MLVQNLKLRLCTYQISLVSEYILKHIFHYAFCSSVTVVFYQWRCWKTLYSKIKIVLLETILEQELAVAVFLYCFYKNKNSQPWSHYGSAFKNHKAIVFCHKLNQTGNKTSFAINNLTIEFKYFSMWISITSEHKVYQRNTRRKWRTLWARQSSTFFKTSSLWCQFWA